MTKNVTLRSIHWKEQHSTNAINTPHSHPEEVTILKSQVFCQTHSNYIHLIISHMSSFYSCSEGTDFSPTKVSHQSSFIFLLS